MRLCFGSSAIGSDCPHACWCAVLCRACDLAVRAQVQKEGKKKVGLESARVMRVLWRVLAGQRKAGQCALLLSPRWLLLLLSVCCMARRRNRKGKGDLPFPASTPETHFLSLSRSLHSLSALAAEHSRPIQAQATVTLLRSAPPPSIFACSPSSLASFRLHHRNHQRARSQPPTHAPLLFASSISVSVSVSLSHRALVRSASPSSSSTSKHLDSSSAPPTPGFAAPFRPHGLPTNPPTSSQFLHAQA